jgi:hypothetical protein
MHVSTLVYTLSIVCYYRFSVFDSVRLLVAARVFGGVAVWKLGAGMKRSGAALRVLVMFRYSRIHEHKANNQTLITQTSAGSFRDNAP